MEDRGPALHDANLIVGKNATGKSRIISIISTLGKLLSGHVKMVYVDGNFDAIFEHNGSQMRYLMEHKNFQIVREEFVVDDKKLLRRAARWVRVDCSRRA